MFQKNKKTNSINSNEQITFTQSSINRKIIISNNYNLYYNEYLI